MSSPFHVNSKDSCYNITVVLPDKKWWSVADWVGHLCEYCYIKLCHPDCICIKCDRLIKSTPILYGLRIGESPLCDPCWESLGNTNTTSSPATDNKFTKCSCSK